MRAISTAFLTPIIFLLFNAVGWGQQALPFVENFSYSTGDLVDVSGGIWEEATSTTSVPVQVTTGNLTYTDYPSSGVGNKIELSGGASRQRIRVACTEINSNGETVFASFLLKLVNDENLDSSGDYFASFTTTSASTTRSKLFIRPGSSSGKYQLGLAKTSSEEWLTTDFDVGTTYLIVISYDFLSGSNQDRSRLWINPDLSGTIPSPDIELTSGGNATELAGFRLEQDSNTPNAEIDGLRIALSWSQAPLPVELSSFHAFANRNSVRLRWKTASEINNYGFDVERKKENSEWEKIGFVAGSGNSNSPKNYSFTDKPTRGTLFSYRLKQKDMNGNYKYYGPISVKIKSSKVAKLLQNSPNPFNPSTSIKFYIPKESRVKIQIFDVLGREVTTLLNEQQKAGYHIIYWDGYDKSGNAAASGIYIYRLTAGDFVQSKKMNLLK